MRKIPTVFERDWDGDRSRVLDQVVPGTEWVFNGEGVPTRKYDGSACLWDGTNLYRRHEVREGKETPPGFVPVDQDIETHKVTGWVPVTGAPQDKWHVEALSYRNIDHPSPLPLGTYELVGPKVQGNPEGFTRHSLISHERAEVLEDFPYDYDGMRDYLADVRPDIEGVVFHHPDGRMAKIKARDFGLKRQKVPLA